jgi:hypothetical protein
MLTDFYTRDETDTKYTGNVLEIHDELSILIVQIEVLLFTKHKEVIGYDTLGISLEDLLFTFDLNEADIKSKILTSISSYCPLAQKYPVSIDVKFYRGTERDVAFIDIYVTDKRVISVLL